VAVLLHGARRPGAEATLLASIAMRLSNKWPAVVAAALWDWYSHDYARDCGLLVECVSVGFVTLAVAVAVVLTRQLSCSRAPSR
jgi:hypothetical protein